MTDRNSIWRAIAEAVSAALPESPDRQALAWNIAEDALDRLESAPVRRWVGLLDEPCWVCSRMYGEHVDGRCPEEPARARLDALLQAFDALGVRSADVKKLNMGDRVDHIVTIGVTSYVECASLAAELDMPRPQNHIESGYAWVESAHRPERGTAITIQAHRVGKNSAA